MTKTPQHNVPELRFPEFEGEWNILKLNEVLLDKTEGIKRGPFGGALKKEIFVNEGYAIYEQRNAIYDNQEFRYYINKDKYEEMKSFEVQPGDLIMSCSGTIGKLSKIPKDYKKGIINQALIRFRTKSNILSQYFLFYMRSNIMQRKILEVNPGSAITNLIPVKELKNLCFPLPNLNEQEKIGTFFSKLDRQIELEEKKLELLEQQKKGYMQKIFSQELRFKDENGNEYPEWKQTNFNFFMTKPNALEKGTNIQKNQLLTVKLQGKGVCKANENRALKMGATIYYKRFAGQFIYGKQNFFNGAFGIVPNSLNHFYSSSDVPALDLDNNKITNNYFINYISRESYYKKKEALSSGTGSKRIHEDTLLTFDIMLPSIKEQKKIGVFLERLDNLIEKQSIKIKQLKQRKQGLLQKMFI
ncbi:restriction endonuclease subunit S [Staphylococcus chromogenes]|uniref:restriction endonuclease subunit S n=1 Tax=Staphylococcus chromogenes TaxID=46126 RepID=UPI001F3C8078|nr:restriction endonuclease subunit S [Staphylococcus chromogenes]MCE5092922.1 restriction endonuclease subunit S [Staphylococcus chromogenes]